MDKTDQDIRFERAVALKAIAGKAKELQNKGAMPFEVQAFINGARDELTAEAPDPDTYRKALKAASMQQMQ
jgi:hypothetical protein